MRRGSFPFWRDVIKLCIPKKTLWSEFPMDTNLTGSEEPTNFWHNLTGDEAVAALDTDRENGLQTSGITNRVTKFGLNELKEAPPKSIWAKLWAQFNDFTIWLLIGAAVISAVIGRMDRGRGNPGDRDPECRAGDHPGAACRRSAGGPEKAGRPRSGCHPGWAAGDGPCQGACPRRCGRTGGRELYPG